MLLYADEQLWQVMSHDMVFDPASLAIKLVWLVQCLDCFVWELFFAYVRKLAWCVCVCAPACLVVSRWFGCNWIMRRWIVACSSNRARNCVSRMSDRLKLHRWSMIGHSDNWTKGQACGRVVTCDSTSILTVSLHGARDACVGRMPISWGPFSLHISYIIYHISYI